MFPRAWRRDREAGRGECQEAHQRGRPPQECRSPLAVPCAAWHPYVLSVRRVGSASPPRPPVRVETRGKEHSARHNSDGQPSAPSCVAALPRDTSSKSIGVPLREAMPDCFRRCGDSLPFRSRVQAGSGQRAWWACPGDGSPLSESLVGEGSAAATPIGVRYQALRLISHQGCSRSGFNRQEPMIRQVTPCMRERCGFHTTKTPGLWKGQGRSRRIVSRASSNCEVFFSPSLLTTQPRESGFSKSQRLLKKPLSLGATKDLTGAAGWYQGRLQPASWIRAYRVSCDAQREGFILPGLRP